MYQYVFQSIIYCTVYNIVLQCSHYELGSKNGIACVLETVVYSNTYAIRRKLEHFSPKLNVAELGPHARYTAIFFFFFKSEMVRTAASKKERSEGVALPKPTA